MPPKVRPRVTRGRAGSTGSAKGSARRSPAPRPRVNLRTVEKEVFKRTNARRNLMQPKLKILTALVTAAQKHAAWLAMKQGLMTYKTPHKGKGGSTLVQRISIKNCGPAENVGWVPLFPRSPGGKRSDKNLAKDIMKAWMASALHKKNILDSKLKYLGVGAAIWKPKSRASWQVVMVQNFSENAGPEDADRQSGHRKLTVFE